MTQLGKDLRAFRRQKHKEVLRMYAQTAAGKRSTPGQLHATVKQILRNYTAHLRRSSPGLVGIKDGYVALRPVAEV